MSTTYDFKSLSPEDFERLAGDLLSRLWSQRIESFRTGRDKGIDLRASINQQDSGQVIVQCKRFEPNAFARLLRHISTDEVPKVQDLAPARYVVVTSVSMGVEQKDKLVSALTPWCRSAEDVFSAEDVNMLLRQHPDIEQAHFKLWLGSTEVLKRLLNADVWNLTGATLDEIENQIRRFVIHDGIYQALDILQLQHHCMIVGVPGIGKTTLAQILLLHYVHLNYQPVIVTQDIEEAWRVLTAAQHEHQKLIVLYDDFLGQVSFDSAKLGKNEESRLIALMRLCERRSGLRFILTTREYILADAMRQHAKLADAQLNLSKFTLKLGHYTKPNRARILFNHLFFSDLPDSRLNALVQSRTYRTIVEHENFSPRIVEAISQNANFHSLTDKQYLAEVVAQLDDPASIWALPFDTQIRAQSRFALIVVWSFAGPALIEHIESAMSKKFNLAKGQELTLLVEASLQELDGNFIVTDKYFRRGRSHDEHLVAKFHNPSIRDFLSRRIEARPAYLNDIATAAVAFEQIVHASALLERIERIPEQVRKDIAFNCWKRGLELLEVASLHVSNIGDLNVISKSTPHVFAERLLVLARISLIADRGRDMALVLLGRLHPEANLTATSPQGTRKALSDLLAFCRTHRLIESSLLEEITEFSVAAAKKDLSKAGWLADAADPVALLSRTPGAREEGYLGEIESMIRDVAASVIGEFQEGSASIDEMETERDWLAECASSLDADFDDLLAEFDDLIAAAAQLPDLDEDDERVARPADTPAEFDLDGLFAGLLSRGRD